MPKINEMLLKLEGCQYAMSLDQIWDTIISDLDKTQLTYVRLIFRGVNISTSVYQWKLRTNQTFSNKK